jgi:hypothetical protein
MAGHFKVHDRSPYGRPAARRRQTILYAIPVAARRREDLQPLIQPLDATGLGLRCGPQASEI